MIRKVVNIKAKRRVALVAHDDKKPSLLEWAICNRDTLSQCDVYSTGNTGRLLDGELNIGITRLLSGPLGGDQQIGAMIAEKKIDMLVFFWDPLNSHPHDADIKALLRIATLWNVPTACNRASADLMISSLLTDKGKTENMLSDTMCRKILRYNTLTN